jgi:hypothetical protein
MPRSVVTAILIVALVSCAPELDRQEVVLSGEVACGQGVDVWEGVNTAGQATGCIVYVRFPESPCRAKLWKYAGAGGALTNVETQPDAADPSIQVTERVSKLHVTCDEGAAGQKCKYEIVKVICDEKPDDVTDKPNPGATLARVQPACGGDAQEVWTRPGGKQCRVTIRANSSNDCELVLSSPQQNTLVRLPVKTGRLVTVVDPGWVKAKCNGNAADQKCLAIVVSEECR